MTLLLLVEAKEAPDPTAFKPIHRPPLELDVEVETPDGIHRLPCDSRIASNRPRAMRFSTQRGDGFGPGGCSFSRQIFKDYPDISPMDTWCYISRSGDVAYEGRLRSSPRGNDPQQQVDVELAGWMTYLTSRRVAALIMDRRVTGWEPPSMQRQARLSELGRMLVGSVSAGLQDSGSLAAGISIAISRLNSSYDPMGEAWKHAGGEAIAELRYDYKQLSAGAQPDSDWFDFGFLSPDDVAKSGHVGSTNHKHQDAANQSVSDEGSGAMRYAFFEARRNHNVTGDYANLDAFLSPRIVGNHGLTERGTRPEEGYWLSDIIRYILQRYFPKIEWAGQDNTYPVQHLTLHDNPEVGYQAIQQLNGLANWETNVWEYRRFHFHPADLRKYDWIIRTTDPGVRVMFDGPSIENFANGVEVAYTDFYGIHHILYPSDHAELRDDDDSNPANRHGEDLWTSTDVPWPCFEAEALQFGRAELAEYNRPKRPGRYRIQGGYIRDAAGHWQQGWRPRCSQTLGILDHLDDRPRLVTATSWDPEAKALEITVDAPPNTLIALAARQQRAREAANLN